MVLFIDDLDRCMPDNIRIVLEAVNFIVTSGECFVIMGLARRPVEAGVGLSFEKIVGEITPLAAESKEQLDEVKRLKRWEFSRQYLDKLINIEIPARAAKTARFEELVTNNGSGKSAASADLLRRFLKIALPIAISVLLIASMTLAGCGWAAHPILSKSPERIQQQSKARRRARRRPAQRAMLLRSAG